MEALSPLYEDVQMSEVFSDSKYFVDCVPKMDTATILADYAKEKTVAGFNLKTFVLTHFQPPAETDNSYSSANKSLPDHLAGLWDDANTRSKRRHIDSPPSSIHSTWWPFQGSVLLGQLFYHAGPAGFQTGGYY
jgi:neutral trehalase